MTKICCVGFGEAAQAFAPGWLSAGASVTAFDIKTLNPKTREAKLADYEAYRVAGADSLASALDGCDVAFSLVTADQAFVVAEKAASLDLNGALWLDCNSCAPSTKQSAADAIAKTSGRYVDVAVMSPVKPKRHEVPLLVSGQSTDVAIALLSALGMRPEFAGAEVGQASTIKMLRSVMIKGTEALFAECFLSAQKAGVLDEVIGSLNRSNPEINWPAKGGYTLERMVVHGVRRAAEMREVAKTVAELGLPSALSEATVQWQSQIGGLGIEPDDDSFHDRLSRILKAL